MLTLTVTQSLPSQPEVTKSLYKVTQSLDLHICVYHSKPQYVCETLFPSFCCCCYCCQFVLHLPQNLYIVNKVNVSFLYSRSTYQDLFSFFCFFFVLFANFQQDCFTVLKKSLIPDLCTSALKAEATQTEDTVVKNYAA